MTRVSRSRRLLRSVRAALRGFTLIEVLVAISILTLISMLIYGAFAGMKRSKEGVARLGDRYHEGRGALARISREISGAYLSLNAPIDQSLMVTRTAFIGTRGSPADRVNFASFAHRRLDRDSHEADQSEISYFGSENPKKRSVLDLVRRETARVDLEPERGGKIQVLATDIDLFDLEYLDALTGQWVETWDTTQTLGQPARLPLQVRITLVLNGGARSSKNRGQGTLEFTTKVALPVQSPLNFVGQP